MKKTKINRKKTDLIDDQDHIETTLEDLNESDDIEEEIDFNPPPVSSENMEDSLEENLLPSLKSTVSNVKASREGGQYEALKTYIQSILKYELLTPEEEKRLTRLLHETGDVEVAKKLVVANLRLVVKIAMEYRHSYQNVLDLIQEGNIGLMKAVSKFDPNNGAKLSYYASWWIRSFILKFILDNFRLVKIGTTQEQKKLFYNLLKEKERLMSQGIHPDAKLIAQNLSVSEKAVIEMDQRLSSSGSEVSLDRNHFEDSGTDFHDMLPSDEEEIDEKLAFSQGLEILKDHLQGFVTQLKPRDREIFEKRLLSEVPLSLQAIADDYGVSRERIRQVESRLVDQLKVYMGQYLR